jgi:hypothetical protein
MAVSGPIVKDKLFFFGSYEDEGSRAGDHVPRQHRRRDPRGQRDPRAGVGPEQLSSFLSTNFGYETGPFQGYDHETPATRYLAKLDYNLNDRNKLSFRYNHLDSETDVLSNSSSLGFGNRRTNTQAELPELELHHPREHPVGVGEWNSTIGRTWPTVSSWATRHQDESRGARGATFFPIVDILEGGSPTPPSASSPSRRTTSCATTPSRSRTTSRSSGQPHVTFGASAERYESENVFFPGSQSAYVYNSLADFYTDANDYLANPNRTTSPVTLRRFQVRWSNIPGQDKPVQPLEVWYTGLYAQDEWQVNRTT